MKKLSRLIAMGMSAAVMLPTFAFAQSYGSRAKSLGEILRPAINFFKYDFISVLVSAAVILIIINIIRFIIHKNDGSHDAKKMGTLLAWNIGGLFVIVAIWGIIAMVSKTVQVPIDTQPPDVTNLLPPMPGQQ